MVDGLSRWTACEPPGDKALAGRYGRLESYQREQHLTGLFSAICGDGNDGLWRHIPLGPFEKPADLDAALSYAQQHLGWKTMTIQEGDAVLGMASFMRIRPEHGSAEVGCVVFGPSLQRTRIATEAIYLMGKHLFDDLGYRRFEWKCNNANEASRRAALRFGFRFEGVFRNDMVVKGKNRNTAWYAMTDDDWPDVKKAFEAWLSPGNFDAKVRQRACLRAGPSSL